MDNSLRFGRFTSSKIQALMTVGTRPMTDEEMAEYKAKEPKGKKKNIVGGFGMPALKYIKQKGMERRLGRRIDVENNARPLQWGKCVESIPFEKLGTAYKMCSADTIIHPEYDFWAGTPDMIKYENGLRVVCDIKCPLTLESFCDFVDCITLVEVDGVWVMDETATITKVREFHADGETYYWQLVSNAILTGCNRAELVVYMPYESELQEVKNSAEFFGYQWIVFGHECELPYLIDGGHYKNINVIPFDIPQSDIDLLTANVIKANSMLEPTKFTVHDHNVTVHDSM
jgi:hypothetical protein